MAEMVEGRTHDRMIEEGVLKPLMRLADSQEAEVKSGEKWREPLLCSHPSETDSHPPLVRVHAAVRIMGFISDPDATVSRFGVLGIANLAVSRDTHQELFDVGAVAAMVTCCNSTDLQTRRAVAFGFNNISSNPANHNCL